MIGYYKKIYRKHDVLLKNIKKNLPKLKKVLDDAIRYSEDDIYRYYHSSFKVYSINNVSGEMIKALSKISPNKDKNMFHGYFSEIIDSAMKYNEFKLKHNQNWSKINRPKLELFFHARYFLEQAIKYSDMKKAPQLLPSGWAALLHLYGIR